jgi:hypothetical protein
LIQEIYNLLLEFKIGDEEFKHDMLLKMSNRFSELAKQRIELQQDGDFSQAQQVYLEYVEIGKFIREIPE